jgi:hypothetical protein
MNKILVPISFSKTSKNALVHAFSVARQFGATLSLLHCYPSEAYNRKYKFGKDDYDTGIRQMLITFFNECIENKNHPYKIITYSGSLSGIISKISPQYDLLIMSRKTGFQTPSNRYFSDKLNYITTQALCPVLITTTKQEDFSFHNLNNIWHIQRNETERNIVLDESGKFGIKPTLIITKSLAQKKFVSAFWENIVTFTKSHDTILLKAISKSYHDEQIDLVLLVNRIKGMFELFVKDEAFQIISQFDIPILIFQHKMTEK